MIGELRAIAAETTGTALLLAVVVGSGIMGERLAGGNVAIALLANSMATGLGLYALIVTLAPVSGAHLNPLVTLAAAVEKSLPGLLLIIGGAARHGISVTAAAVGSYIAAAYWFTASTSFANPAVTVARALTDTFAGVRPADVAGFILAQCAGASAGAALSRFLFAHRP